MQVLHNFVIAEGMCVCTYVYMLRVPRVSTSVYVRVCVCVRTTRGWRPGQLDECVPDYAGMYLRAVCVQESWGPGGLPDSVRCA